MRALLLAVIAACSFNPSQAAPAAPNQDGSIAMQPDAPAEPHDDAMLTPHDAQHDARPADACVDSDHDGVCDSVEWPCGDLPPPLGQTIEVDHNGNDVIVKVSSIELGSAGQRFVGTPGETVSIALHYSISDSCSTCADQIEWGWGAGARIGCLYDDTPGNNTVTGSIPQNQGSPVTFKLPTTPGAYDVRINDGQNYGCNDSRGQAQVTSEGWWQANPGSANTIAKVCVH
ncbi:MAG TPA: hypothetical protein VH143_02805 [Kofleriaceae bacterium]|jgi:hypothetical protein|nr:hypothetical protein [Kofleriaceae bacterium]